MGGFIKILIRPFHVYFEIALESKTFYSLIQENFIIAVFRIPNPNHLYNENKTL